MKRKQLLVGNIIGAVLILLSIIHSVIVNGLVRSLSEASAIGLIGGADGPTAVFISGSYDFNSVVLPLLLLLMLLGGLLIFNIVYLIKSKKSF